MSASLARSLWPGQNPLGKQLGDVDPIRVVGVVSDVRLSSIQGSPRPSVYLPLDQAAPGSVALYIRTSSDSRPLDAAVQDVLAGIALRSGTLTPESLDNRFALILLPQRVGAWLAGGFGAFALGIAAVGLYGILAYAVEQRRREIGVRMALGADGRALVRHFVWQGMVLAAAGLALGIALAIMATRVIAGMLYGISPVDPLTYAATAGLVTSVMVVASLLPARQAAKVDAAVALRAE